MSGVYGKEASLHYTDFLAENQLAALRRVGAQKSKIAAKPRRPANGSRQASRGVLTRQAWWLPAGAAARRSHGKKGQLVSPEPALKGRVTMTRQETANRWQLALQRQGDFCKCERNVHSIGPTNAANEAG